MRKIALLVLIALLTPQLALAAWWNPFSWGNNSEPKKSPTIQTSSQVYTFYTKSNARVRECRSTDCKVLRTLLEGTQIEFNVGTGYSDSYKLPEWVDFAFFEDGKEKSGYIRSDLLTHNYVALKLPPATSSAPSPKSNVQINKPTITAEDEALKKKNDQMVTDMNKLLDEMKVMVEERDRKASAPSKAPVDTYQSDYNKALKEYYACGKRFDTQEAQLKARTTQHNQEFKVLVDSVGGIEAATKKYIKDSSFQKEWNAITKNQADSSREELYLSQEENRECGSIIAPYIGPTQAPVDTYVPPTFDKPVPYVSPLNPTCLLEGVQGNLLYLNCNRR